MKKIIFEGKTKANKSWQGTHFQPKKFKDKFGTVDVGESRSCTINTIWGQLHIPNYTDMNVFANKKLKITVEIIKEMKKNG